MAENACDFARRIDINTIVFTSSIAPYGTWEDEKTEKSLPMPNSAYGISTLVAEEIQKRTRQFAKRQLTWFRREAKIEWYQPFEQDRILSDIKVYLEN